MAAFDKYLLIMVIVGLVYCQQSLGMEVISEDQRLAEIEETRGIHRLKDRHDHRHIAACDYEELRIFCHQGQYSNFCSSN